MGSKKPHLLAWYLDAVGKGQPKSGSAVGKQAKADGLNRDRVVADHELMRHQYELQGNSAPARFTASTIEESLTASVPLSSLKEISLSDLSVGKRHMGRVLFGRLCVVSFKVSSINTVLEDADGRGVRVTIHNVLKSYASDKEIQERFPLGMRVAIKEPYFKLCADSKTAVRVDSPADICVDEDHESAVDSSNAEHSVEQLETIRSKGNRLFAEQNWVEAVSKYSKCIKLSLRKMEDDDAKDAKDTTDEKNSAKLDRIVMLAYSNRAESWIRLQCYENALSDADEALQFDNNHVKTLVRKGKALHGLSRFEKACKTFKAALEQSPEETSILENLDASSIAYEQSQNGVYELSKYYTAMKNPPACADFVGPVEIRRVEYGNGRRGLFLTTDMEAGGLLLVSNPLAIVRQPSELSQVSVNLTPKRDEKGCCMDSWNQQDLLTELTKRVMSSKREMAQLYSLLGEGTEEKAVPSMDLFRPGSEWIPPEADKMEVDIGLLRKIAKTNGFGNNVDDLVEIKRRMESGDTEPKTVKCGIWLLPSFANHSCAPNCSLNFVGDALFMRPVRALQHGEELTISYFANLYDPVHLRRAATANWNFHCECERCSFESSLEPFVMTGNALSELVEIARVESQQEGNERQAAAEVALVADYVEELLRTCGADAKKEDWIRGSFLSAYLAKYKLAADAQDAEMKIAALKVISDAMVAVGICPRSLQISALLLKELEKTYFRHSIVYRITEPQVLSMFRAYFGKMTNRVLFSLIKYYGAHFDPIHGSFC